MKIIEKIRHLFNLYQGIERIKDDSHDTRLLIGSLLAQTAGKAESMKEAEFKVFSQFGDDGIIQFLLKVIQPSVDTFVEFGVENYEESNTRFLLMHDNWRGLVIDGSQEHINFIKSSPYFWRYDITAVQSFITADNINQILADNGFAGKIGLLSIDIDGNDYWVWQAITVTDADIVIAEYNSLFGAERAITVPYDPNFIRSQAHYSHLYFGSSLTALCDMAQLKGYAFIGCNQAGNNAYFVKKNLLGSMNTLSVGEGYREARFRENRDQQGRLTYAAVNDARNEIKGLPVVNTRTGLIESV